jgi:pimeloyl-ACP methyl ester carboxylesterase
VIPKLPSAWTRSAWTAGHINLTLEPSSGLPAPSPRSCVQKLAYETDKLLVSKLASLKPSDLKDASELIQDVADFAETSAYHTYRDNPEVLFPDPVPTAIKKRWLAPHRVGFTEWTWQSIHPLIFEDIEPVYRSYRENQKALLRTLNLRIKGKPMAILVNGFSSGHHLLEWVAWPMREFRRLGINVSLFALPFHGPRGRSFPPAWPQQDTKLTIEGFRQAIGDLRTAIRAVREAGASHVGVAGMSLGGYTVSLLATTTADVDFVLSYIPIANLPDTMNQLGLIPGTGRVQRELFEGYRKLLEPVSPECRKPMVEPERMAIISAEFDRLATVEHGARLASHFGTELITFPGAHMLQLWRARAFRRALEGFQERGVLPRTRCFAHRRR